MRARGHLAIDLSDDGGQQSHLVAGDRQPRRRAALQDLKASAQDIVMLRVYVVNATSEAFGQAVAPLRELFGDTMLSITTIGVQALYKPEIKVEIEMVVRLP